MSIEPCPFCYPINTVRAKAAYSPVVDIVDELKCVVCRNCGAIGSGKAREIDAVECWNNVSLAVITGNSIIKNELAAYNKLSGGKTAIEYAMWVDNLVSKEDMLSGAKEFILRVENEMTVPIGGLDFYTQKKVAQLVVAGFCACFPEIAQELVARNSQ